MSPTEIVWRVKSALRDQADLVRVPLRLVPRLPDDAGSFESFRPGFTCSPVNLESWQQDHANLSRWKSRLLQKTDNLLENRLSYFDLEAFDHGTPFNWHRDHSAGVDSPVRLSVLTDYRDFKTYGDCKLVWEPNRHHHLVVLARAFVATGEHKYAAKVAEQLRSWIDANPFGYGMNWKSVLEHGVRLINWVWALDLIRGSNAIDDQLWADIRRTVYLLMWDTQRKFSRGSSANNHLIGELAGVFVASCYFTDMPHVDEWRRVSQSILEEEILKQTYADGCTQEHTFGYEFFVIQFFLYSLRAGDETGHKFSSKFRDRLHQMYRFMDDISADTGAIPNINDRDDGYVLDVGEQPNSAADLLSVGGYQFDDRNLVSSEDSETVFWLFGALEQIAARPARRSVSYLESGYSMLRSDRMSVFFDHAELGYGPIAAHGHADCLSVIVSVDGRPFIVDAGTYDYFTHPEWRDYFRTTRAHNTVEIDGTDQSQMQGPFLWGRRAQPNLCDWLPGQTCDAVSAQHDGYTSLDDPVTHRRSIELNKEIDSLRISDQFECTATHEAKLYFHLDPACKVLETSDDASLIELNGNTLRIASENGKMQCIVANDMERRGWISTSYHRMVPSSCIEISVSIEGNTGHDTIIEWTR